MKLFHQCHFLGGIVFARCDAVEIHAAGKLLTVVVAAIKVYDMVASPKIT